MDPQIAAVLQKLAKTIEQRVGFQAIAMNLYRPDTDDYLVAYVLGSADATDALLGTALAREVWIEYLGDRESRLGSYFIPEGQGRWIAEAGQFLPEMVPGEGPNGWQPGDELITPMCSRDGAVLALVSVDKPVSGQRPADSALLALRDIVAAAAPDLELALADRERP